MAVVIDMQRGLLYVVKHYLPEAEHRWCAMHIFSNWQKRWRGIELRMHFWKVVKSPYSDMFLDNLEELEELASGCVLDLLVYPPHT